MCYPVILHSGVGSSFWNVFLDSMGIRENRRKSPGSLLPPHVLTRRCAAPVGACSLLMSGSRTSTLLISPPACHESQGEGAGKGFAVMLTGGFPPQQHRCPPKPMASPRLDFPLLLHRRAVGAVWSFCLRGFAEFHTHTLFSWVLNPFERGSFIEF